jgi:phage shock protein A
MQARAGAIDELIASGALDDATAIGQGDDIARELDAMSSQSDVEAELAALKAGGSGTTPQLGAAGTAQSSPVEGQRTENQPEGGQA